MKKILSITSLLLVLATTACQDVIDVQPTHVLGDNNVFTKIEDFDVALNGAYANMRGLYLNGLFTGVIGDMMSDNLHESAESLVNYKAVTDWVYKADQLRINQTWAVGYNLIHDANTVLGKINEYTSANNQKTANRIRGQALALRGWTHFNLLRYYANNLDRNSTDPGVAIKTQAGLDFLARSSVKECYDQIYKDLEEARQILGDVDVAVNTATKRSRIDRTAVTGMLARVALYAKEYDKAANLAQEVIRAVPLATRAQFPGIWTDGNVSEVLFATQYNSGEGGPALDVFSPATNRAQWDPARDLVALYSATDDVRYTAYFTPTSTFPGVNRPGRTLLVGKYTGRGTARDGNVNFKVLRVAEMYLIAAEALALTNKSTEGLALLNQLRAARIAGFTPGTESGAALTTAIAVERRKELWLEGHRWFDIKRTTRTLQRSSECRTNCTLPATNVAWTWPIPQDEMLANSKMTQTTGY
ncbi:MAG: RagB/SusD family nutrient uptake outer membrane protein [Runella slithyformis]|nr:MAG: RagB/SusD family nutrient uptake outer membrane protein [Runella slithyformis]TAE93917.1 MAG: RagB/SusD family nutrient uptake outer membrane protein [Runella slithyformis]TAF44490.1 MAG: RagB/SusD family nutrient uptake outer membrane protein [Runella slithyformis]TAF78735.1 MAG: RagB/SusD family nutrient uptake outer membrane protein [Runella slithyformis]